jgi:hypothetical protein
MDMWVLVTLTWCTKDYFVKMSELENPVESSILGRMGENDHPINMP